MMDKGLIIWCL